jgi:RNA polymerase sigma-70 factor (ECF subfamily)
MDLIGYRFGYLKMNEQQAIRKCLNGDHEAYSILVRNIQRQALFLALRILRNEAEAEDAVQISFIKAFECLEQFDLSRAFYPWFRVILKNECLKRLARTRREVALDDIPERQEAASVIINTEIRQALDKMSDKDRTILHLKHLEERSYEEIATKLNIPIGTVMSRLHEARSRLRQLLLEVP